MNKVLHYLRAYAKCLCENFNANFACKKTRVRLEWPIKVTKERAERGAFYRVTRQRFPWLLCVKLTIVTTSNTQSTELKLILRSVNLWDSVGNIFPLSCSINCIYVLQVQSATISAAGSVPTAAPHGTIGTGMWFTAGPHCVLNSSQEDRDLQWPSGAWLCACWYEWKEPSEDQAKTQAVSELPLKQASI